MMRMLLIGLTAAILTIPILHASAESPRLAKLREGRRFVFSGYMYPLTIPEAQFHELIGFLKTHGYTGFATYIQWDRVEKEPGKFDWSHYDSRLRYIVDQGLEVELKIATKDRPRWVRDKEPYAAMIYDGRIATQNANRQQNVITFASDEFNELQARFMTAITKHFREIGLPVLTYTPVMGSYGETEYECWEYSDYSPYAQAQFRTWLKDRYHDDLAALNKAWEAGFATWGDVKAKYDGKRYSVQQPDLRPWYLDFIEYREWSLGKMLSRLATAMRDGDPDAVLGVQVGRIWSVECAMRGTFGTFAWARDYDMFLVDPSPLNDVVAAADQVRASGKLIAMELDGPGAYVRDKVSVDTDYPEQARKAFGAGTAIVYTANWGTGIMRIYPKATEQFKTVREAPVLEPIKGAAIYLSKWGLYAFHEHDFGQFDFRPEGAKGRPIDVITDDMILMDPKLLEHYEKIHVQFSPVTGSEVYKLLMEQKDRLVVTDERFGKELLARP